MKKFFLLVALAATPAWGGDVPTPAQKIVGAETPIPLGELVVLDVSTLDKGVANLDSSSYDWKVLLPDGTEKRVKADGTGVVFGAGIKPGKLKVFVAATYLFIEKDPKDGHFTQVYTSTKFLSTDVVIGDGTPSPSPTPPPPTPQPPAPSDVFGLTAFVADNASRVNSPTRALESATIAAVFKGTASAAAAGALKTVDDLVAKTLDANRVAIGASEAAWSLFDEDLDAKLSVLQDQGRLKTLPDFIAAWNDIAAGLEKVK